MDGRRKQDGIQLIYAAVGPSIDRKRITVSHLNSDDDVAVTIGSTRAPDGIELKKGTTEARSKVAV
jgi:hypothetical protein